MMPYKVILCYVFIWSHGSPNVHSLVGGLAPGSFGGVWLVDTVVLPVGLETLLASTILALTSPLGFPCSVLWLAASIHLCICQALAEPFRGQLYQALVNKHFLVSAIG